MACEVVEEESQNDKLLIMPRDPFSLSWWCFLNMSGSFLRQANDRMLIYYIIYISVSEDLTYLQPRFLYTWFLIKTRAAVLYKLCREFYSQYYIIRTLRRETNKQKAFASFPQIIYQKNTWNLPCCATTNKMKSNEKLSFFPFRMKHVLYLCITS